MLIRFLAFFMLTMSCCNSFADSIVEPVDSKKLFNAEYIHHGLDQTLWLFDDTAVKQLSEQNGQWMWSTPNRLPLPSPEFSQRITRLQSTQQRLWFLYQNALYSIERTNSGIDMTSLQSVSLPQYGNDQQLSADRVTAMQASFYSNDVFFTERDSAENAVLYRYTMSANGISRVSSLNTDCDNTSEIYVSDAHLLMRCTNSRYQLFALTTDQLVPKREFEAIEPIFMAEGNNTFIYLDNITREIVWLNLNDNSQARQAKDFLDIQRVNPQGDILVRGYTPDNNVALQILKRQADNRYVTLNFEPDHPFASFSPFNQSSYRDALLYINGNQILLGGGRSELAADSGLIHYIADDLLHQLRTTSWPLILANNSFIIMDSTGSQIWQIIDNQLPEAPILTPRLADTRNVAVQARAATGYENHWWQIGYKDNFWYLQHLQADGTTEQIQFPAQPIFDLKMHYYPATDSLLLIENSSELWWCDNATALNTSDCRQVLALDSSINVYQHTFTENGVLIHQINHEGHLAYYEAETSGLVFKWQKPFPHSQLVYWPGGDKVWVNQTGQDGNPSRYVELDFVNGAINQPERSAPAPNLDYCHFSDALSVCQSSGAGIHFKQLNNQQTDILAFYPNFTLLHSGEIVSASQTSQVLINFDRLYQYKITLPTIGIGALPGYTEVWQDENLNVDLSTVSNADVSLSWFAFGGSTDQNPNWFTQTGDKAWTLDTSNEVAYTSPLINVTATLTSGDWQAFHSFNIKLNNINDAPLAVSTQIITEPLEIGESYQLSLSDIFIDPDGEVPTYQVSALPSGFRFESGSIIATPNQVGDFSFTVTAIDSEGLSATTTIVSRVIAKVIPGENSSSGGGMSQQSMLLLLIFFWLRHHIARRNYA